MIRRNRTARILKVSSNHDFFEWNLGVYMLDPESVNLTSKDDVSANPTPELVFREGDPVPLGYRQAPIVTGLPRATTESELDLKKEEEEYDADDERMDTPAQKKARLKFQDPITWDTSPAGQFLDRLLIGNYIESVSQSSNPLIPVIMGYLNNPARILMLIFAGIIAVSFIMGLI